MTTEALRLSVLGTFHLERGSELVRLPRRKTEALLAYLALHPQPHAREKIAALFWGDATDEAARRSLRVELAARQEGRLRHEPRLLSTMRLRSMNNERMAEIHGARLARRQLDIAVMR